MSVCFALRICYFFYISFIMYVTVIFLHLHLSTTTVNPQRGGTRLSIFAYQVLSTVPNLSSLNDWMSKWDIMPLNTWKRKSRCHCVIGQIQEGRTAPIKGEMSGNLPVKMAPVVDFASLLVEQFTLKWDFTVTFLGTLLQVDLVSIIHIFLEHW